MAVIVPAIANKVIQIGRAGENLATTVQFDVADWIKPINEGGFGTSGTFSLFVQQGGGQIYPQNLVEDQASELDNNIVEWNITDSNTATIGLGKCELVYSIQEVKVKSVIYDIVVTNSLDIEAQGNVPSAIDSWLNEVSQMTEAINNAAPNALLAERYAKGTENGTDITSGAGYQDNAKYYAQRIQSLEIGSVTTGAAGSSAAANVSLNGNTLQLNLTIPRGNTGTQGPSGTITVDSSITTGEPGTNASVSNSGSSTAANLHFTIPKGDKGDKGDGFTGPILNASNMPTANSTYANKIYLDTNNHIRYVTQSGSSWSWQDNGTISGLPSQTSGDNGKFLTTNGSIASWASISIPSAATSVPLMDSGDTGTVGISSKYALEDHIHPIDTSRQAKITASGILKGNGSGTVSAATAGTDYIAPPSSPNNGNVLTYNGSSWVASAPATGLPDMTDNSGKYLTTNGSAASWVTVDLSSKADIASPNFTGTPTAPTATAGTNTTQVATTAFVGTALNNKITYGTLDLTAGTSPLASGVIYLVYE